ncbi:amino acid ABC transporter substrate-binding protein, PAAT family [Variovorax sp. YR750]|uniref:ABC transporter substrate-binding protein n=1 Tax=Variovorax sp. YR750 TaxID=1884384 RepID=UPI0008C8F4EF|nr:ABC transporter substrate-binding protein [Variovorax sp. YR750]SEL21985.1 amino acid ABC transporter substrate-binding protein, PAAT family [Variovorax sp. YR750]
MTKPTPSMSNNARHLTGMHNALRRLALPALLALTGLSAGTSALAAGERPVAQGTLAAPAAAAAVVATPVVAAPAAPAAATFAVEPAAAPTPPPVLTNGLVRVPDGRLLAPDIARIVMRGELVVAMLKVDTPPFFFFDDGGQWTGLEVGLAQSLAKELGVKLRFNREAGTFNAVVDLLANGQADLAISKLSRTLARSQTIAFSDAYLTLNHSLILNRVKFAQLSRGRPLPEVIRNFDGSIGVIAKSSFADYARTNFPHAKVQEYPTWNDVLVAVHKGEIVSAYRDEFEVKRVLKADPTVSLVLRTVTLKDLEDTLGIGVAVTDTTLLAYVNQFLAQRAEKLDIQKVLQALDR